MENDEEIRAHVVSIWRESKKFLSIGGREGMLVLTDKHLSFIHKTTAKIKWWKAITQRQALIFMKSKDTMIHHDGYDEKDLVIDQKNPKNTVLSFNDILNLEFEEKEWGSVLTVEYSKNGKKEKHQYSVAQDWVKYPVKVTTKFMKVDWFLWAICNQRSLIRFFLVRHCNYHSFLINKQMFYCIQCILITYYHITISDNFFNLCSYTIG